MTAQVPVKARFLDRVRREAAGGFKEVKPELAKDARSFLLQPSIVRGTFAYWARRS